MLTDNIQIILATHLAETSHPSRGNRPKLPKI